MCNIPEAVIPPSSSQVRGTYPAGLLSLNIRKDQIMTPLLAVRETSA